MTDELLNSTGTGSIQRDIAGLSGLPAQGNGINAQSVQNSNLGVGGGESDAVRNAMNKPSTDDLSASDILGPNVTVPDSFAQGTDLALLNEMAKGRQAKASANMAPFIPTTDDYFPGKDQPILQGYYEGKILGKVPIFTPAGKLFPFGVYEKRRAYLQRMALAASEEAIKPAVPELNDLREDMGVYKSEISNGFNKQFGALIERTIQRYGARGSELLTLPQSGPGREMKALIDGYNGIIDNINSVGVNIANVRDREANQNMIVTPAFERTINQALSAAEQARAGFFDPESPEGKAWLKNARRIDSYPNLYDEVSSVWKDHEDKIYQELLPFHDDPESDAFQIAFKHRLTERLTPEDLDALAKAVEIGNPRTVGTGRPWSRANVREIFDALYNKKDVTQLSNVVKEGTTPSRMERNTATTNTITYTVPRLMDSGEEYVVDSKNLVRGGNRGTTNVKDGKVTFTSAGDPEGQAIGFIRVANKDAKTLGVGTDYSEADMILSIQGDKKFQNDLGELTFRNNKKALLDTDKHPRFGNLKDKSIDMVVEDIVVGYGGIHVADNINITGTNNTSNEQTMQFIANVGNIRNAKGIIIPASRLTQDVREEKQGSINFTSAYSGLPVEGDYIFLKAGQYIKRDDGDYDVYRNGKKVTVLSDPEGAKGQVVTREQAVGFAEEYWKEIKAEEDKNQSIALTGAVDRNKLLTGGKDEILRLKAIPTLAIIKANYNPNTFSYDKHNEHVKAMAGALWIMQEDGKNPTLEELYEEVRSNWDSDIGGGVLGRVAFKKQYDLHSKEIGTVGVIKDKVLDRATPSKIFTGSVTPTTQTTQPQSTSTPAMQGSTLTESLDAEQKRYYNVGLNSGNNPYKPFHNKYVSIAKALEERYKGYEDNNASANVEFEGAVQQYMDHEHTNSASANNYKGGGSNWGTNDPSIKTKTQAKAYYKKNYWSRVIKLPPGLRSRAFQMAINTGDPYGELMVAAGMITTKERIDTKTSRKDKGYNELSAANKKRIDTIIAQYKKENATGE